MPFFTVKPNGFFSVSSMADLSVRLYNQVRKKFPAFLEKFKNAGEKATSKGWGGKDVTYLL